jgi:hypothetical protein
VCTGYARTCIPQPGTSATVDAISDRLMHRLQYRNFGPNYGQGMVVNHTVDMNDPAGHAGIRWYQLWNDGLGWYVRQQGNFSPDASHRWMGSAAMDVQGNIALGYSVSSTSVYPSIRYTGHREGVDAPGVMTTEKAAWNGGGSQTASAVYGYAYARWGDYSSMNVAPIYGCDFVYTQEYYRGTTPLEWYTGIVNFGFSECWNFIDIYPDTTITAGPPASTFVPTGSFEFTGTPQGGADIEGYECRLDGGVWFDCASPYNFSLGSDTHTFEVRAVNMLGNADPTPASWTWEIVGSATLSFKSQAANDGYVIESTETSGLGGTANSSLTYIQVGDFDGDRQVKGFLSFDTSALPDTAIVTGATLQMRYSSKSGTNPYTTHGPLLVDIKSPFFGGGVSLLKWDFQAGAGAANVANCAAAAVSGWYSCEMTNSFSFVNLLGSTQFRMGFTLDDNDDGGADLVRFNSGNHANAAYWPVLIVEYYVP